MNISSLANKQTYLGLFMVSLSMLMFEIHLTRIFSVTMWYHFAFMAISISMFGMTVGALLVYLLSKFFQPEKTKAHLGWSALIFSITILISFIAHITIPFSPLPTPEGLLNMICTFGIISVPFVFSGICICLALTRFPLQVSSLYAADLAGAATGCLALVALLNIVDGATAVIFIALLASVSAILFFSEPELARLKRLSIICACALGILALLNLTLYSMRMPLLNITHVKVGAEPPAIYEKWNSFSRIRVFGNPFILSRPWDWGLSPTFPPEKKYSQLLMSIDAAAFTPLDYYKGKPEDVEHLKYDVTNIAHYLRHNANVLVIGVGGGRDIISALIFNQKSVLGVDINDAILNATNHIFGKYTGHLDQNPRVKFVNDEACSYIARCQNKFDLIQISLIDTSAATAAGAFALTENSLYTVEAWKIFLEHLNHQGVLTVSRWYFKQKPGELYRLTVLATEALKQIGIQDPRNHIMIVATAHPNSKQMFPDGVGNILVSREPFTNQDIQTLKTVAARMEFDVVLTPQSAIDPTFATLANARDPQFINAFPLNISAPTDDSPYFFQLLKLKDMGHIEFWNQGVMSFNLIAVSVLGELLLTVILLTLLCIIIPLCLTTDKSTLTGAGPLLLFFGAIGLGFMFIEISQMQRLIIFLGHPIYSLTVVLFTLLISSSLGSFSTINLKPSASLRLGSLIAVLVLFGLLTPFATTFFRCWTTEIRILVSILILFPLGFFMGMAFPIGMRLAALHSAKLTPWLWGINGATSVCASVAAIIIAIGAGVTASFWTGVGCYGFALLAYILAAQPMIQARLSK